MTRLVMLEEDTSAQKRPENIPIHSQIYCQMEAKIGNFQLKGKCSDYGKK